MIGVMQMVEPGACVAFFPIDTAVGVAERLATVADRLGIGTIIHDCKEAVTSSGLHQSDRPTTAV